MKLNGGRHVQGILRGFDPFMNLVIDECVEMAQGGQQNNIGMVVSAAGAGWGNKLHHYTNLNQLCPKKPRFKKPQLLRPKKATF